MSSLPTYSHINIHSLTELSKAKAPASVLYVYTALCSFDFKGSGYCFPKISTIAALLEHSLSERTIYWALNWLKEKGFLRTQSRTSRKRFELVLRKTASWLKRKAKQTCNGEHATNAKEDCNGLHHKRTTKRKTLYSYKRRASGSQKSLKGNQKNKSNQTREKSKTSKQIAIEKFNHEYMVHCTMKEMNATSYVRHSVPPSPCRLPASAKEIEQYIKSLPDYRSDETGFIKATYDKNTAGID